MRLLAVISLALLLSGSFLCDVCQAEAPRALTILSNNVGLFPSPVVERYPPHLKEKKRNIIADEGERVRLLAAALADFEGDPDLILLQEIWSVSARDALIRALANEYPHARFPRLPDAALAAMHPSGLVVLSKLPLEDFAFEPFRRAIGLEKAAHKGILGVRVVCGGRSVALFNTHLQAGNRRDPTVRPDQLLQANRFIRRFTAGHDDAAIVLAGDLNTPSTDETAYRQLFTLLDGARDSYRTGCSKWERTGRNAKDPHKRIDYLLTFGKTRAVSTIVDPAGDRVSDHLAVFGRIMIDEGTAATANGAAPQPVDCP